MISRDTFQPKLTEDALNTKVFNVMPNRDLIPRVDDPGNLFQKILCRAPIDGSLFACHSITRSLCEIVSLWFCFLHAVVLLLLLTLDFFSLRRCTSAAVAVDQDCKCMVLLAARRRFDIAAYARLFLLLQMRVCNKIRISGA
jgi:hypothetical protein